jgi:GNAT superfamily N-acetyltransferase
MGRPSLVPDAWLSRQLGYAAYHLPATAEPPTPEELPAGPAFVDAKVPTDALARLHRLEAVGFQVIDTSVQLTRPAVPLEGPVDRCRFARPDDEGAVRTLAAHAITQSRFHLDPAIPRATANQLKAEWAGNFFSGRRGEWMVVAADEAGVCGFLQLLRATSGVVIDLIGVAAGRRSQGLGGQMVAFAARECLHKPAALLVGTQIANARSLVFYHRQGFAVTSSAYVLHLHRAASP